MSKRGVKGSKGRRALPKHLAEPRPGVKKDTPAWKRWIVEIEAFFGYRVCGACNTRGCPCPQPPMEGRTRCYHHGGKSLRGVEHYNWKGGRKGMVASLLPGHLAEAFKALVEDPDLLALDADLAIADLQQRELLVALRQGADPMQALRDVREHLADLHTAAAEGDLERLAEVAQAIADAVERGSVQADTLDRLARVSERRRKLADTERKRRESMQAYISAEEARAYNSMVISLITTTASEVLQSADARTFLARFLERIALLNGQGPSRKPRQLPEEVK